jgi:hypothetical protein
MNIAILRPSLTDAYATDVLSERGEVLLTSKKPMSDAKDLLGRNVEFRWHTRPNERAA